VVVALGVHQFGQANTERFHTSALREGNGPSERQINKLKLVKRSTAGEAREISNVHFLGVMNT